MPWVPHSSAQTALSGFFYENRRRFLLMPLVELDVRVTPGRIRVADVAVFFKQAPREKVVTVPPVAVIEILSPGERYRELIDKLEDYRRMGVPNIWLVNTEPLQFQVYSQAGLLNVDAFELPEYGVRIDPSVLE